MNRILHVDMDAFYASVEVRDCPSLRDKPVIVGGSPERRGVVCAANYVARTFGVHSAMPAATARRLCPQGVFLPTRMDHYAAISRQIREILHRFTPLIEPLSLDEAFLDVTGTESLFGSAPAIARQIKAAIFDELRLPASVGVAPNKFLAKIASDLEKPDGLVVVNARDVLSFLDPLPVQRLWGVGRQASKIFDRLRIHTIAQLRSLPVDVLTRHFGSHGEHLWRLAHGEDDREVVPDRAAKSISHETTFYEDIHDQETLRRWLLELTDQVARRLRRNSLRGRTVQIKVRFSDFTTITRCSKLAEPDFGTDPLWQAADKLLDSALAGRRLPVRLLGMGVSEFDHSGATQRRLFDEQDRDKRAKVDEVGDQLRHQFGPDALRRASTLAKRPSEDKSK